jgi:hypothetical protein
MYRTNDPRFRRRLNDLSATLESANESAQSGVYIFTQRYIRPCFGSIGNCLTTCVEAGCPHLQQRDRLRRGRRGRAELSFDFYDDWDEDENEGLLGWGDDDGDAQAVGYGTVVGDVQEQQPGRQRGMSYLRDRRRKSAHEGVSGAEEIGGSGFFGRLFGGSRAVRYKPSSADLQDHPGARRAGKDRGEGEALLEESDGSVGRAPRRHGRKRSGTAGSRETMDSLSSRGDIFPSDDEDDAVPLDDEFAMVLERRNTQSGPETETSSGNTGSIAPKKRGKRPSTGSRVSSRRTISTRSTRSRNASTVHTPIDEGIPGGVEEVSAKEIEVPTMDDLSEEEHELATKEEAEVERRREEARRAAAEKGLADARLEATNNESSSRATQVEPDEHTQDPSSAPSIPSMTPATNDG